MLRHMLATLLQWNTWEFYDSLYKSLLHFAKNLLPNVGDEKISPKLIKWHQLITRLENVLTNV